MDIISSISLQNFRGFSNSGRIGLAPLTFLVGPNSSGKSTLANALMFTAQSFNVQSATKLSVDWMGRLIDLGSFNDTVFRHRTNNTIAIEIGLRVDERLQLTDEYRAPPKREIRWKWELKNSRPKKSDEIYQHDRAPSLSITDVTSGAEVNLSSSSVALNIRIGTNEVRLKSDNNSPVFANFWHISSTLSRIIKGDLDVPLTAGKAGYQRIYDAYNSSALQRFFGDFERVTSDRSGPKRWVAKHNGSSVSSREGSRLLNDPYNVPLEVATARTRRPANREPISKYLQQMGIASTLDRVDLSAYHTALQVTDSVTNVRANLADVGYGASQVIPVIRGCLTRGFGPIVIEQPEIHLHPKAQAQLAVLICESSKLRQIFVETHSEHMINRARIMIADGSLKASDVKILYVDKNSKGSHVTEIGITADGDFTRPWPEGFFDERYQDSLALLKLKKHSQEIITLRKTPTRSVSAIKKTKR